MEEAKHAYERAAFTFLPSNRPSVKIALALILEEQGKMDEARKVFTTVLESSEYYTLFRWYFKTNLRYFL